MSSEARSNVGEPAVVVEGLVRNFGGSPALNQVSLTIHAGEFFCLLGPSGCGKTTLLRIIAGLDQPDEGRLKLFGNPALHLPANERPVNTVFQSYALFPHLTVYENVAFGLKMKNVPKDERDERVNAMLALARITNLADRTPSQLSGGQKQRVALARAAVNEPKVLLLDEPLGALDLKLRKELQSELREFQRRLGITFIHVTHDQEEAMALADRIAVMDHGIVAQLGTPEELYERPASKFVAQFLGRCNVIEGRVDSHPTGAFTVRTESGSLEIAPSGDLASGQAVSLAIRPERVRFSENKSDAAPNQFVAVIRDITFLGNERVITFALGHAVFHGSVPNGAYFPSTWVPGTKLMITLPPESLRVLIT